MDLGSRMHSYQDGKSPHSLCWDRCPVWEYLFLFQTQYVTPLFYLSVWISGPQARPQLSVSQTSWKLGGERSLCCSMKGVCIGQLPCVQLTARAHTSHEGPVHTALSLLHVKKKISFHLVLDHVVLSSVTLIPGCSGHKCWTSLSGGWHHDDLCYHPHSWSPPLTLVNSAAFSTSCMSVIQVFSTQV